MLEFLNKIDNGTFNLKNELGIVFKNKRFRKPFKYLFEFQMRKKFNEI